jgi:hypothetical protein
MKTVLVGIKKLSRAFIQVNREFRVAAANPEHNAAVGCRGRPPRPARFLRGDLPRGRLGHHRSSVFGSATLPRPLLPHPGRLPRPRREGVDRLPPLQPPQQPQRQLTNGFRSGRGDVGVVNSGSGAPKKTDDKSFYSVSVGTVSGTVECKKSRQKQFPIIVFPQNVIV